MDKNLFRHHGVPKGLEMYRGNEGGWIVLCGEYKDGEYRQNKRVCNLAGSFVIMDVDPDR